MGRCVVLVVLVACGRMNFDPLDDGGFIDRCGFTSVGTGLAFTCAVDKVGTVWCWGRNSAGQIVPSGPDVVTTPTKFTLPGVAVEVRTGRDFACARLVDGSAWCWGDNGQGQLGDGTTLERQGPVRVQLGDAALELGVGGNHACARRAADGSVMCWGNNRESALGNTGPLVQPMPTVVMGTVGSERLAVGHRTNCVIDAVGIAKCWGRGLEGQLPTNGTSSATPVFLNPAGNVRAIDIGNRLTCAVIDPIGLHCYGTRYLGGSDFDFYAETVLPDALDVAAGYYSGCATRAGGNVACWGYIAQDGVIDIAPTPVPTSIASATTLSGGWGHFCAITDRGLVCWGNDDEGELGRGIRGTTATPQAITLPGATAQIAITGASVCARVAGRVYCWGDNYNGELGTGTTRAAHAPMELATGLAVVDGITAGCAWGGGSARCWGQNDHGQLGNGTLAPGLHTPVTSLVANPTFIARGAASTCAITNAGGVQCWGANDVGQLGDGTTTRSPSPVNVSGLTNVTALALQGSTACAIANGTLQCWGDNSAGQLGDGTVMNRSIPVVPVLPMPLAVALGDYHTCALTADGAVRCWGGNGEGQLGQGDYMDRRMPTQVSLPGVADRLWAGGRGTCARIAGTRDVYCWGQGLLGQNATGVFDDSLSPALAQALAGVDEVVRDRYGGCALFAGVVRCWGTKVLHANGDDSETRAIPVTAACE